MSETTHTISNGHLSISTKSLGGQLTSIKAHDIEYLWCGDPAWWSGQAPNLFPFCGRLRNHEATSSQGDITLPQHGLARTSEHQLEKATDTSLTYLLTSDDESKQHFPFDFEFRTHYDLTDDFTLSVTYDITNTGSTELPFTVGGHPAFNVPLEKGFTFDDYELKFQKSWTFDSPTIAFDDGALIDFEHTTPFICDSDHVDLKHSLFDVDTFILSGVPKSTITLMSNKGSRGIKMVFSDFAYLGVWSKAQGAPYVALEPWTGCSTCCDEDDVFEHKRGITILQPSEQQSFTYTIEAL